MDPGASLHGGRLSWTVSICRYMRQVYTAETLLQAQIARDSLESAGIACHIFNQYSSGALGELPVWESCPQVWVHQDQHVERAVAILRELEAQQSTVTEGACTCPACGESCPQGFEICWNCGGRL